MDAIFTRNKHICPKLDCNSERFITVAHVAQDWEVDGYGNFQKEVGTHEVIASPNDHNIWACAKCGVEAVTILVEQ